MSGSESSFNTTLANGLKTVSVSLDPSWIAPLKRYFELLEKWAEKINLISTSDPTAIIPRHFVDSLSLLRLQAVRECVGQAVDVGSGAGFPGLPLAIACPESDWTLVEPRQRRGAFLNQVIAEIGVSNAHWASTRLPDSSLEGRFDLAVSRATFAPVKLVHQLAPLLKSDGTMVLMAAREPELHLPAGWIIEEKSVFSIDGAPRWLASVVRQL